MKHLYLKCLLFGILSLVSIKAIAYDCKVDGIYYNNLDTTNNTASVTYQTYNSRNNTYSSDYTGDVTIPTSFTYRGITYNVTSIGNNAFRGCSSLKSIKIPNSVTSIGDYTFCGCSSLTSIDIPNSVTSIGYAAFDDCNGFTSVTIPNNVTSIGQYAFNSCSSLKSIVIEDGEKTLSFAYSGNWSRPFEQCPIETLYLGRNITYRSYHNTNSHNTIFSNKTTLTLVNIGNNVTFIGETLFYECAGLTSVTIGNRVNSIGNSAFEGCSNLTTVNISDVAKWCNINFSDCSSNPLYYAHNLYLNNELVTNLILPDNITKISNYAFYNCSCLSSINIPHRLNSIGEYAFTGCSGITTINIPDRVNSIGQYAFSGCSGLTTLSIPNSMTSIGNYAFSGCSNLETVYSEITSPFDINAFSNGTNAILYVPYGTKLKYIQTPGWNVFNDIIEMDPAIMNTSLLLSCNSKGSITINGTTVFTNKIGSVDILEDAENTIVFTPKANCKLEQVCFNGFDITSSVENNTLKANIPANSQMVVMFSKSGDMNNDGNIDISDVVSLVNMILGQ